MNTEEGNIISVGKFTVGSERGGGGVVVLYRKSKIFYNCKNVYWVIEGMQSQITRKVSQALKKRKYRIHFVIQIVQYTCYQKWCIISLLFRISIYLSTIIYMYEYM